jgi:hypothetical protein
MAYARRSASAAAYARRTASNARLRGAVKIPICSAPYAVLLRWRAKRVNAAQLRSPNHPQTAVPAQSTVKLYEYQYACLPKKEGGAAC